jgi:hypothetical protein
MEHTMPYPSSPLLPFDQAPQDVPSSPHAAGTGRYIVGDWSHIFAEGSAPTDLRLVFDTSAQRIVAMQLHTPRGYVDAGRADVADVQESLLTANAHVIDLPLGEGFQLAAEMPDWSAPEARNLAIVQFEREIAFCKTQHGILIEEMARELEAGGDAEDEFHWEVVDRAKGHLAAAAANATTDDEGAQENAIAVAEAWVAKHVASGTLLDTLAAAIALSSANETQVAVFALLAGPADAPGDA